MINATNGYLIRIFDGIGNRRSVRSILLFWLLLMDCCKLLHINLGIQQCKYSQCDTDCSKAIVFSLAFPNVYMLASGAALVHPLHSNTHLVCTWYECD